MTIRESDMFQSYIYVSPSAVQAICILIGPKLQQNYNMAAYAYHVFRIPLQSASSKGAIPVGPERTKSLS
jgi:hypothetical protein